MILYMFTFSCFLVPGSKDNLSDILVVYPLKRHVNFKIANLRKFSSLFLKKIWNNLGSLVDLQDILDVLIGFPYVVELEFPLYTCKVQTGRIVKQTLFYNIVTYLIITLESVVELFKAFPASKRSEFITIKKICWIELGVIQI